MNLMPLRVFPHEKWPFKDIEESVSMVSHWALRNWELWILGVATPGLDLDLS
jgi:hypothetical protein